MDVHHLRYFLAVVDHDSVHAAATALGVAQPTISQALRSLERELGTALFHRIGRGMVPTSAGLTMVGSARRILRGVAAAEGAVRDREGQLHGRLDLSTIPALGTGLVPSLVAEYRRRYPKVLISIGKLSDDDPTVALRSGRCEIVVTHLPYADVARPTSREQQLDVLELGTQEFWIAFPEGSDIPAHDPIGWEELPDIPLVIVPPGGSHSEEIVRTMAAAGRLRPPAAVLQNREARLSFALAGVGGTFIERSLAGFARARGAEVRSFTPALSRRYGLVFEPARLSPAAEAFVELAREHEAQDGADSAVSRARSTKARAAGES
ncbi:MAG: LysR family transcriptional regulator [Nocardioides sp.]|uniref:LysR family transcriptional regulator n=1 Tax=Nocardioides sp. TaxID=35761 RepID=UPI003D6A9A9C